MMEGYTASTEIVVNQPKPVTLPHERMQPRGIPRDWSSGLFDIFDDMGVCLCECLLPFCHACSISKDLDEGLCTPLCVPFATVIMRSYVRGKHNIQGSILKDYCTAVWCGPCMNCQLHREVNKIKNGEALP
ncbi:Cornifelin [Holothuria leucospilota]|uniref:Cornifelin n=1 Tax=Holothuria leucospilota TaxID=206669 RepID=A0A9Q1H7I4_HOLLE|nr:Cornifelin [Holothuria leucospilota]